MFDAFYPSNLARGEFGERVYPDGEGVRYPRLSATDIAESCERLRVAGERLRTRKVQDIVQAIDRAAAILSDPRSELHRTAIDWIPRTTGYSQQMAALVLRRMCKDWRTPAVEQLLRSEFGTRDYLDRFVADTDATRSVIALGPALTAHIFSGNVPGVAVTSLVRALLVKSPSFGKTAEDEPILPVLFAQALAAVDAELAAALHITYWPGGSNQLESALISEAEAVVVYGGDDAVQSVQQRTTPGQRLLVHGPRLSVGVIGPQAIERKTAYDVAMAVSLFDQQGCVSPHVVYVVGSANLALEFARMIGAALHEVGRELPRGSLKPAEALAIREARTQAEFRAIAGGSMELIEGEDLDYTVIFDADSAFQPSCLNRFLYVKPAESIAQIKELLAPHRRFLQSVAIEGFPPNEAAELALQLGSSGASRITSFATLPWPPAEWHHDGSAPLRELIRWVDWA
jgi:acyl-CoA reductase-like NAD-dependent aldehyde dehydrogenase